MGQHLSGRQNFWRACHNARQTNPDHSLSGTGGSAGWLFLFLVLNDLLSLNDLGLVLTTLLLAEVLAHLLVADRVDELATSRRDPASDWHATIGTLLSRWLLLCLGIFVVSWTSWTSLLWFPPLAFLILPFLSLCFALMHAAIACRCALGYRKGSSHIICYLLIAAAVNGLARLESLDAHIVLLLCLGLSSCLLPFAMRGLPSFFQADAPAIDTGGRGKSVIAELGPYLITHIDVLLVPIVLTSGQAALYLVARGLAGLVSPVLCKLAALAAKPLESAYVHPNLTAFRAGAARLNLGFLLIGGGTALALLSAGNLSVGLLGQNYSALPQVLFWLLIGRSAPVFFGATSLLMYITRLRSARSMLAWGAMFVLISTVFIRQPSGPVELAYWMALGQLGYNATCASLLGWTNGIWPGLTAVFCGRLKLL